MPCRLCKETPSAHSFQKIGTLKDGKTNIFYTGPRRAKVTKDSPENVDYYIEHLKDTLPDPWIWIFDAKDMTSSDYVSNGSGKKMINIMESEYYKTLRCVYVVNPTTTMRMFLGVMRPFLKKETNSHIYMCSLGLIEVIEKLQGVGVTGGDLATIMQLVQ